MFARLIIPWSLAVLVLYAGCEENVGSPDVTFTDCAGIGEMDSWADVSDIVSGLLDGTSNQTSDSAPETLVSAPVDYFDPPYIHRVDVTIAASKFDHMNARPQEDIEEYVDLTVDNTVFLRTEMKLHGGFAKTVPKKSYRFTMPDETTEELDLFGDGKERQRRFVLSAAWNDSTYLRGKTTLDLVRQHGGFAPRASHAELYINGKYHGFYVLFERVDKLFLERHGLNKDAHMYKAENHQANWKWKTDVAAGYDIEMGPIEDVTDLDGLLHALTYTPTDEINFTTKIEPKLDLSDFMVWQRVHTFADNRDTFTKNYYLYHDLEATTGSAKDRFRLFSWDADATWGNNWDGAIIDPTTQKWYGTDAFAPRLLSIPEYRHAYLIEYQRALNAEFSEVRMNETLMIHGERIGLAAQRDLDHWLPHMSFVCELERLMDAVKTRHQVMSEVIAPLLDN